ncbi:MAG: hypothetical protein HUK40_21115 [Desulfobacter sp.]|nr:hypothetical protein [Desulfobacter sp.]WDP86552.1 MAG: hypothetical protein HUN05_16680 [Desulfobacter sp.]
MVKELSTITICLFFLALTGCSSTHQVEIKPVEIKPIHITIDVNVKVDKALDDFFGDIDAAEDQLEEDKGE